MTDNTSQFLNPVCSSDEERNGISFDQVPEKTSLEPKFDMPIDPNPLAFDPYAIE